VTASRAKSGLQCRHHSLFSAGYSGPTWRKSFRICAAVRSADRQVEPGYNLQILRGISTASMLPEDGELSHDTPTPEPRSDIVRRALPIPTCSTTADRSAEGPKDFVRRELDGGLIKYVTNPELREFQGSGSGYEGVSAAAADSVRRS